LGYLHTRLPAQQLHQHAHAASATAGSLDDADEAGQRTLLDPHTVALAKNRKHAHHAVLADARAQEVDHFVVDRRRYFTEADQPMHAGRQDAAQDLRLEVESRKEVSRKQRLYDVVETPPRGAHDPWQEGHDAPPRQLPLGVLFLANLGVDDVP